MIRQQLMRRFRKKLLCGYMMGSYSSLVYCLNRRRFKNEGIPRTESGGTGGKRIGFSSELKRISSMGANGKN